MADEKREIFRGTNDLWSALSEMESQNNVMTLKEFEQFAPLYRNHGDPKKFTPEQAARFEDLTAEFVARVDLYKPLDIINGKGEVVLRFPARLSQMKTLDDQYEVLADINTKFVGSDRTDLSLGAFDDMMAAFMKSQATDENLARIVEERKVYGEQVKELYNTVKGKAKVVATDDIESDDVDLELTMEFDDD